MRYVKRNIGLTQCQLKRLKNSIENEKPISFSKYEVSGSVPVYLTDSQAQNLGAPLKLGIRQLQHMKAQGGFLGALLKLIGPVIKAIAPVAKAVGPAVATGALSGAASYGASRLLKKGIDGKGFQLKPYKGGAVTIEVTLSPKEVNALGDKKRGGFLGVLASLAASLLPTLLGNGLSNSEVATAKEIINRVGGQKSKKNAQAELNKIAKKYQGSGLLGKLFGLPGNKVPVLGDIPLLNVLF